MFNPSTEPPHRSCTSKAIAMLFNQDGACFRFEADDHFFVFMSTAVDEINETIGNGLLADIYPILRVSMMDL